MSAVVYQGKMQSYALHNLLVVFFSLYRNNENRKSLIDSLFIPSYLIVGSSIALANFYQTRRFTIEERPNYPDIAKFMAAASLLAYCNIRYFTS